ncbi:ABC transporter permease [Limisphaera ngatamarikiensis]|uniref:ABC transporter permease n=1 Tax=Limisphaera ngatamarikiensis TaxID=1324935 RepID=A0A6M1RI20_9BACT|nr:ABC transporter permease subunit [Limisphaera ngatamarikiensis]NGO39306.1 ABC transporter permease [Limisphaera ngatamarikiensis]
MKLRHAVRNEFWKLFGKKRTYIGFVMFFLAQLVMLLLFQHTRWQTSMARLLEGNGYIAAEFMSALTVAVIMLIPQILLLMPLYATLVGGDLVAKEAEDGTLRMILARPIGRLELLTAKWLAGAGFAILLVLVLGGTALGLARLWFPWKGMFVFVPGQTFALLDSGTGLGRYVLAHLFLASNAFTMLSLAFMFSCFRVRPAAATILALSYLFLNLVLESIPFFDRYELWLLPHHFRCWLRVFNTPIPWWDILQSQAILAAVNATTFIVGAVAFQSRDFKN